MVRTRRCAVLVTILTVAWALTAAPLRARHASASTVGRDGRVEPFAPRPSFYDVPDPLPEGRPGDLIAAEQVSAKGGVRMWRVLYHSRSVAGDDIAVSGLVAAPTRGSVPPRNRIVVAFGGDRRAMGDQCALSRNVYPESDPGASPLLAPLFAAGHVWAQTDGEGRGTAGTYPFGVGESAAHSTLDIARAARQLPGVQVGKRVVTSGIGWDAAASLFAVQLAPTYAPELEVVGAAPVMPVVDPRPFLSPNATDAQRGYGVMLAEGLAAAHPDEVDVSDVLTSAADADGSALDGVCGSQALAPFAKPYADVFARDPLDDPVWGDLLFSSVLPRGALYVPVLLVEGDADPDFPTAAANAYADGVCAAGGSVDLRVYPGRSLNDITAGAAPDLAQWILDRAAGVAAPASCSTQVATSATLPAPAPIRLTPTTGFGTNAADWVHARPNLYDVPDPLSKGAPGELIRAEEIGSQYGVQAWRVLYHSRAVDGRDIAVSGIVMSPSGRSGAPVSGDRVVVTDGHGYGGPGDACAPSRAPLGPETDLSRDNPWAPLLEAGYVVALTDYEGLGVPGFHPLLVGESEGRGMLDIARAARQLPGTRAGTRVVTSGASQGGHASLYAASIAPTYAPELEVLGAVALAPAPIPAAQSTVPADRVPDLVALVKGMAATYPTELSSADVLMPEAEATSAAIDERCDPVIAGAFTKPLEQVFTRNPLTDPTWRAVLDRNDLPTDRVAVPVLLAVGDADPFAARLNDYVPRACAGGTIVDYRVYPGVDHGGIADAAGAATLSFIDDRAHGVPRPTACTTQAAAPWASAAPGGAA